ncbi:hypothetical protein NODU109028_07400 [Nocardioides dubius]
MEPRACDAAPPSSGPDYRHLPEPVDPDAVIGLVDARSLPDPEADRNVAQDRALLYP